MAICESEGCDKEALEDKKFCEEHKDKEE